MVAIIYAGVTRNLTERDDIKGSKSEVSLNIWPPQPICHTSNVSDIFCLKLIKKKSCAFSLDHIWVTLVRKLYNWLQRSLSKNGRETKRNHEYSRSRPPEINWFVLPPAKIWSRLAIFRIFAACNLSFESLKVARFSLESLEKNLWPGVVLQTWFRVILARVATIHKIDT